MVGHFVLHAGGGVTACEDDAFLEGGIEASVFLMGEPDEVRRPVVGCDAVEMVALKSRESTAAIPCGRDEEVNKIGVAVVRYACTDMHLFVGLFTPIVNAVLRWLQ